ncbi:hypothetical protein GCM10010151_35800 [Actinoallomurus spadix]|uniref:Uncharacterized protein n=1 Tax=Actinoallomurus spadix TaxID=79912 RepID=A0ABP3GH62_9ACTN
MPGQRKDVDAIYIPSGTTYWGAYSGTPKERLQDSGDDTRTGPSPDVPPSSAFGHFPALLERFRSP